MFDVEDPLCGEVLIWDSVLSHPLGKSGQSVFWCVSVYSICVVGLLVVFCKIGNSGAFY